MYLPSAGLDTEDILLQSWAAQPRSVWRADEDGVIGESVVTQVVTGNGWDQAMDATDWE